MRAHLVHLRARLDPVSVDRLAAGVLTLCAEPSSWSAARRSTSGR